MSVADALNHTGHIRNRRDFLLFEIAAFGALLA
jgi:hypothetical protein